MDIDGLQTGWAATDVERSGERSSTDAIGLRHVDPASALLRLGGAGGLGVLAVVSASVGSWGGAALAAVASGAVVVFTRSSVRRRRRGGLRSASMNEDLGVLHRGDSVRGQSPEADRWSDAA